MYNVGCQNHYTPPPLRNELSWRYQNLLQSLDHKRSEVEQLSNDFEARIRSKEVSTSCRTFAQTFMEPS